jgi:hypothetical protein
MRSRANFCFAQFRVYWEKWKSNHTCTSSLKIGVNKKIKRWPAKHPSWPANLIMHRSWWPVYLPDLFRGLVLGGVCAPPPLVDLPLVLLVYIPTSPALGGFSSLSTWGGVEIIHRLSQLNNFLKMFVRYFLVQEWQRIQEHQEYHYDSKMYNIKHDHIAIKCIYFSLCKNKYSRYELCMYSTTKMFYCVGCCGI